MLNRLKRTLVDSFVGAIALGWLLAQGIVHFSRIFSAPVAHWTARNEYRGLLDHGNISSSFSFQDAVPDLIGSLSLLLVWYLLFRWLYFTPLKPEQTNPTPNLESDA